jgi:hypothetical protein
VHPAHFPLNIAEETNNSRVVALNERAGMSVAKVKKRKHMDHPAMECPTPDEPCVFTKTDKPKSIKQMN